jgi:hypothetical protein
MSQICRNASIRTEEAPMKRFAPIIAWALDLRIAFVDAQDQLGLRCRGRAAQGGRRECVPDGCETGAAAFVRR